MKKNLDDIFFNLPISGFVFEVVFSSHLENFRIDKTKRGNNIKYYIPKLLSSNTIINSKYFLEIRDIICISITNENHQCSEIHFRYLVYFNFLTNIWEKQNGINTKISFLNIINDDIDYYANNIIISNVVNSVGNLYFNNISNPLKSYLLDTSYSFIEKEIKDKNNNERTFSSLLKKINTSNRFQAKKTYFFTTTLLKNYGEMLNVLSGYIKNEDIKITSWLDFDKKLTVLRVEIDSNIIKEKLLVLFKILSDEYKIKLSLNSTYSKILLFDYKSQISIYNQILNKSDNLYTQDELTTYLIKQIIYCIEKIKTFEDKNKFILVLYLKWISALNYKESNFKYFSKSYDAIRDKILNHTVDSDSYNYIKRTILNNESSIEIPQELEKFFTKTKYSSLNLSFYNIDTNYLSKYKYLQSINNAIDYLEFVSLVIGIHPINKVCCVDIFRNILNEGSKRRTYI